MVPGTRSTSDPGHRDPDGDGAGDRSWAHHGEILPGRTGRRTEIHPCHRSTVHHDEIHADRRHQPAECKRIPGNDRIAACGGSWMVKGDLVAAGEFDKITELTKEAVMTMLGFELKHIGINCENEEEAEKTAGTFASLSDLRRRAETVLYLQEVL